MKILILSDNFPPYAPGGAERSAFDLARALQERGHQVFIITTCQEKSILEKEDLLGLKIFRIYANYQEKWRAHLSLYNPQTVGRFRNLLKEINPDIVHANNIHQYLSYYCLEIAGKFKKPVLLTVRDVMLFNYEKLATKKYLEQFHYHTSWLDHLKQAKKRYNPFRNIIIRHYLECVNGVFAISYALKRALAENKIKNTEVIYNGIDFENWKINPESARDFGEKYGIRDKKIILFGGRLNKLKGGEEIIRAMKYVADRVPKAVLLVVGKKTAYSQKMSELTESLGIKNHAIFTGWLDRERLKSAYFCSDVVAVPSTGFDSFNLFNIEAMAAQKPVVGTCYGGTPEIVEDMVTGYIVNPYNIELMAKKIIDLLENPEKARQFGRAGYERVKKEFSLDRCVKNYETAYAYALAHPKEISWRHNIFTSIIILPLAVINNLIKLI